MTLGLVGYRKLS